MNDTAPMNDAAPAGRLRSAHWPPPATIGMPVGDVDTPALLVDLDAFERNLDTMTKAVASSSVRIRPHAKTHKSPDIARLQIARGAVGVCSQKVSEAEALVDGDVRDILVTNQIVGAPKVERLARLARRARVGTCVDDALHIDSIGAACTEAGSRIDVYIELDVGQGRCGVAKPADVVALARQVRSHPALRFAGLQAYHGRAQHLRDPDERRRAVEHAKACVDLATEALKAIGIDVPVVTGGGTGTYRIEASTGWHEIQPGSYIFMDADYGRNRRDAGDPVFENSLFIWTTVISTSGGRLVVDAGLKAYSMDSGPPHAPDAPGWQFAKASDEHGIFTAASAAPPVPFAIGDKLRLIPGHCDPTVNLHDWYVGVRGGVVEVLWPVAARGAIF